MTGPRALAFLKWTSRLSLLVGVVGVVFLVVLYAEGSPWLTLVTIGATSIGCLCSGFSIRASLSVLRQQEPGANETSSHT